jgi:hypothetical protein
LLKKNPLAQQQPTGLQKHCFFGSEVFGAVWLVVAVSASRRRLGGVFVSWSFFLFFRKFFVFLWGLFYGCFFELGLKHL